MWSGTANAATATCPTTAPLDLPSATVQVTIQTTSGGTSCWDFGIDGNPTGSTDIEYGVDVKYASDGDTKLQLPGLSGDYTEDKVEGPPVGTDGFLKIGTPNCEGTTCTAAFNLSVISTKDMFVGFKFGGGNNFEPSWAVFKLAAGFVSTIGDVFSWTVGSYVDGVFVPSGTASSDRLSHSNLFRSSDPDEFRPIPIPAAAWLLGSGLLGLFAIGRRRKGQQVVAA
jgi:hypothetical protein